MEESVWRELADAGLALHSELSLGAVLGTLINRATSLTNARWAAVGVLDRSGADFERYVGRAELLRRPPDSPDSAMLDVPIVIRGVPYARLVVAEKRDREAFAREDGEALSLLAQQAAVAIENARRYESATRRLAEVEALGEITDTLVGELDLSRLLVGVTERLQGLLDARAVFTFLPTVDGDYLEVRAAAGEQARKLLGARIPREGSKTGRVFDRGRSERVDAMIEDVEVYQPLARQMNARAGLIVPIVGERGAVGAIAAVNKRVADDVFSADDHASQRHSQPGSPSRSAWRQAADGKAAKRRWSIRKLRVLG